MRRRYEDVSNLVQYQLKTNQQGNIEVYVDDRFVGNVSEGVCNWKDIEYKSKVTISLKGVEDKAKTSSKRVGPYCHIYSIFGGNESYHAGPAGDYVTSVSDFPFVTGPGNDSVEFEGEGRLIVETEASHYEIEVS